MASPTLSGIARRAEFPVFDADNHFYEYPDAFTRYLPANRSDAVKFVEVDGRTKIALLGQVSEFIPNPTFERVGHPGAQEEYFRVGNPENKTQRELIGRGMECPLAFREPAARLERMNEQGLDYALVLPTLVSLVEERMRLEPDVCHDVIHALNRWMAEEWPFVYEGRIYATPYITTALVDRAVAELEWVLERGARAVLMRPAPAWGHDGPRSFGLPEFDPFWRLVEESGVVVILHVSDSGYDRYYNEWLGADAEISAAAGLSPFRLAQLLNHRPIEDTITSLIGHGTFWRFPKAKTLLVENGCGWVTNLLHHLDNVALKSPADYEMTPSDTFRQNVWVQANHEDDPRPVMDLIGNDRVMFGSDYPHLEGMKDPLSYLDHITDFSEENRRRYMGGNMLDLMGVEVSATV